MKIERFYLDGTGKQFRVLVELDPESQKFERAILQLANRARAHGGRATDFHGALVLTVEEME